MHCGASCSRRETLDRCILAPDWWYNLLRAMRSWAPSTFSHTTHGRDLFQTTYFVHRCSIETPTRTPTASTLARRRTLLGDSVPPESWCAFEMPNGWRMPLAQRYRRTHTQGQFRNGAAETQDVPAHPKPFHMTSKPTLQDCHSNPLLNSPRPLACCRQADHSRSEASRDTRCFDMRLSCRRIP